MFKRAKFLIFASLVSFLTYDIGSIAHASALPPNPPTKVSASAGNSYATVSFTAGSSNGSTITGYTVTGSPGGVVFKGTKSPIKVTGLTNGTSYTFTVTATNSIGISAASLPSAPVIPATVPSAPTGVTAIPHNASAIVAFTPGYDGGAPVSMYTASAYVSGSKVGSVTGIASPINYTGLTNGVAYTFKVKATNSKGTGSSSVPMANSVKPLPEAPSAPTGVSATAGNTSAVVSFSPGNNNGSAITGYTVTASPGGATFTGTTSPITATGLTNYTAYTFTVTASNAVGSGTASIASAAVTPIADVPPAPVNVSAVPGDASASVSFISGATSITAYTVAPENSYTVTASPGGATFTSTASPILVTGLVNGTSYTFTVTATNNSGTGAASAPSAAVIPIGAPSAPTGAVAVAHNSNATVSFNTPASNGGAPITGYTVTASPGGLSATGTASPITVFGLSNGTAYTFTVVATNSAGDSGASDPSQAVAPQIADPSSILDLSNWYLTLPTGVSSSTATVYQPALTGYSDSNFLSNTIGDGVIFKAAVNGVTTSGSAYPRSELREQTNNGATHAAWNAAIGTHILSLTESIDVLPPVKPQVVGAQIHETVGSDVIEVMASGYYPGSSFYKNVPVGTYWIAVRLNGVDWSGTLDSNYTLGTPYNLTITDTNGSVAIAYTNQTTGTSKTLTYAPIINSTWYFKAGCYTQSNLLKGDVAPSYGQTTIRSLSVTHN